MADEFKIGIIGAGGISGAHVNAVKASGGRVQIVGVVDPLEANRNTIATETGANAFDSMDSFLDAVRAGMAVDGVVVCTPPNVRVKIVEACLKAKIAVLSEKPIASTLKDAKVLAALAKKHKKVAAYVAYCHRFAPAVNAMIAHTEQGKIGTLVRVENVFACDLPGHEGKWFSDPKKAGGGAYLDMGSHSLDLFRYIAGEARTLGASFRHKWKKRTETAATVLVESKKKARTNVPAGVAGVIVSGWAETSRFTLSLVGDGGMLSYDYEKPTEIVFKDLLGKAETIAIESHDVRFARQMIAFADAVQKKAKTALASFEDGLAAAELDAKARKLAE